MKRKKSQLRGKGMMIFRVLAAAVLAFLSLAGFSAANAQYHEGACGGAVMGYDHRAYPCRPDRKPVCEQSTGRCVCLLRRECGAQRDEGWYDKE